ncbi:MAG: tetratricopeptide repeat protein [Deltaproteobacteria bacterium]|nr:tetratricopeptide repeat protein [Deltaproteobacteria bacterium]
MSLPESRAWAVAPGPGRARIVTWIVIATLTGVASSRAAAEPARPAPRSYRVVVLPYWSAPGADLASLGAGIARELARETSRLAQTDRLVVVPSAEVDAAIATLAAAERDALTTLAARGDPAAALPLFSSVAKASNADLLVVGTVAKVGGGAALGATAQTDVESWLLARSPEGSLEEPLRHSFRAPLGRSQAEIARQVAQDDWWSSADEIAGYVRLGTFHPNEAQKKILELGSNAKRDRLKVIQTVFPEEFIHAQTCDITPTQMRDVTLATQQFVEGFEPKNPRSHNYRGLVEYCGKNEPQALRYFEKASSLDPTFPDPWYNAGWIYWKTYQEGHSSQDLDRAFAAFSKAVEAESGFAEARAKRGLAWLAKGDPQKAEADLVAATSAPTRSSSRRTRSWATWPVIASSPQPRSSNTAPRSPTGPTTPSRASRSSSCSSARSDCATHAPRPTR